MFSPQFFKTMGRSLARCMICTERRKPIGAGVIFFLCKLPSENMQIRSKLSLDIDGADTCFPMIHVLIQGNRLTNYHKNRPEDSFRRDGTQI
jgi:hypothetical protein